MIVGRSDLSDFPPAAPCPGGIIGIIGIPEVDRVPAVVAADVAPEPVLPLPPADSAVPAVWAFAHDGGWTRGALPGVAADVEVPEVDRFGVALAVVCWPVGPGLLRAESSSLLNSLSVIARGPAGVGAVSPPPLDGDEYPGSCWPT